MVRYFRFDEKCQQLLYNNYYYTLPKKKTCAKKKSTNGKESIQKSVLIGKKANIFKGHTLIKLEQYFFFIAEP